MKVLNQNTPQTQAPHSEGSSRRTVLILIGITVLLISLVVGVIMSRQQQTTQNKASEVGPSCPLNGFVCSWQKEEGVTYSCTILEVKSDGTTVTVANPDVTAGTMEGELQCVHTPLPDRTYRCSVMATKFEGCSTTVTGDASCLTVTTTPTPTPTPTVTPTPTPNPMCYITTCNPQTANHCATQGLTNHTCVDTDLTQAGTDYRCVSNPTCTSPSATNPADCWCSMPSPTPTATPTPTTTVTPTPTTTVTPTSTPTPTSGTTPTPTSGTTPTPTPTSSVQSTPTPTDIIVVNKTTTTTPAPTSAMTTSTPVPTLPVAGLPAATYLIVLIGIAVVAIGLAL